MQKPFSPQTASSVKLLYRSSNLRLNQPKSGIHCNHLIIPPCRRLAQFMPFMSHKLFASTSCDGGVFSPSFLKTIQHRGRTISSLVYKVNPRSSGLPNSHRISLPGASPEIVISGTMPGRNAEKNIIGEEIISQLRFMQHYSINGGSKCQR